jgi:hypothetical protein
MTIPTINRKATYPGFLHVNDMIPFNANIPYANLLSKYVDIIKRIDNINIKIKSAYESYQKNITDKPPFQLANLNEHCFIIEEIIYWLRKTADELIAIMYVCKYFEKNQTHPNKIKFEKIDDLLKNQNSELSIIFVSYLRSLENLNSISNAYKHSFVNSQLNIIGEFEPIVPALSLLYNNTTNPIKFYSIELAKIINDFSDFFVFTDNYLRTNFSSLSNKKDNKTKE